MKAAHTLAQDLPMSDMRASADYRLKVAQNLIQRSWLETGALISCRGTDATCVSERDVSRRSSPWSKESSRTTP